MTYKLFSVGDMILPKMICNSYCWGIVTASYGETYDMILMTRKGSINVIVDMRLATQERFDNAWLLLTVRDND